VVAHSTRAAIVQNGVPKPLPAQSRRALARLGGTSDTRSRADETSKHIRVYSSQSPCFMSLFYVQFAAWSTLESANACNDATCSQTAHPSPPTPPTLNAQRSSLPIASMPNTPSKSQRTMEEGKGDEGRSPKKMRLEASLTERHPDMEAVATRCSEPWSRDADGKFSYFDYTHAWMKTEDIAATTEFYVRTLGFKLLCALGRGGVAGGKTPCSECLLCCDHCDGVKAN